MSKEQSKSLFDKVHDKHDFYVKEMFSRHPELVSSFLKTHLPKDLSCRLDLKQVTFCKTEFHSELGGKRLADIVLRTRLDGKHTSYIVIVAGEHESRNERLMAFRKLEYLVLISREELKRQERAGVKASEQYLPLVLQFVIYHNKRPHTFTNDIRDLVGGPRELIEKYYLQPFPVIDFSEMDDGILKQQQQAGLLGLALKYAFKDGGIEDFQRFSAGFLNFCGQDMLKLLGAGLEEMLAFTLEYIASASQMKASESVSGILNLAHHISPEVEERVMSIWGMVKEEGIQQGMQQGMRQGKSEVAGALLKQGMSVEQVIQLTDLDYELVKGMQQAIIITEPTDN